MMCESCKHLADVGADNHFESGVWVMRGPWVWGEDASVVRCEHPLTCTCQHRPAGTCIKTGDEGVVAGN